MQWLINMLEIGLSILIGNNNNKIILLPLTIKQDKSMKAMKNCNLIQRVVANDKQMLNIKTMELQRK